MGERILVVDDEDSLRSVISSVLTDEGYQTTVASSAEEALEIFRQDPHRLLVTDIFMGKMTGLDLLHEVKLLEPDTQVVVMTSNASLETATQALRDGAYDYLTKPFEDIELLTAVVARAVERITLASENSRMIERLQQNTEELERLNRQLREIAVRDGLTGLYNHRYFREALDLEIARARRHRRTFSLIFMDLDHFKHYNDALGHLAGDELLRELAGLIKKSCRTTTIAARYGGEEFVMLTPETDKECARICAERLRNSIESHPFAGRDQQPAGTVTLSIGVSTFPEDGYDADSLIAKADSALYRAKEQGRNLVCC
jgi:diguanylate cyclase (GGDEF)-like protein